MPSSPRTYTDRADAAEATSTTAKLASMAPLTACSQSTVPAVSFSSPVQTATPSACSRVASRRAMSTSTFANDKNTCVRIPSIPSAVPSLPDSRMPAVRRPTYVHLRAELGNGATVETAHCRSSVEKDEPALDPTLGIRLHERINSLADFGEAGPWRRGRCDSHVRAVRLRALADSGGLFGRWRRIRQEALNECHIVTHRAVPRTLHE